MEEEDEDIIEELHRIRLKIFKEAGGTIEAYGRYYYEIDKKIFGEGKTFDEARAEVLAELAAGKRKRGRKTVKPAAKAKAKPPARRAVRGRKTATA